MQWSQWISLLNDLGIVDKEAEQATSHFVSLSEICYYKGVLDHEQQELIILDPQWISDALAMVLSLKRGNSTGFLSYRHLASIWKAPDYHADYHQYLIQILRKFYMLFDLPDSYNQNLASASLASLDLLGYKYLFPNVLPDREPAFIKVKSLLSIYRK